MNGSNKKRQAASLGLLLIMLITPAIAVHSEEVALEFDGLRLLGTLEKSDSWPRGITLLMTHGTLSHKDSEIITTLQSLFLEAGASSLAINLSLGVSERRGSFDCSLPHTHRLEDAPEELMAWLQFLEELGVRQVVPLGHSRGANQTARFTSINDSPLLLAQILVAPPVSGADSPYPEHLVEARRLIASGRPGARLALPRFLYCNDAKVSAQSLVSYYGPDPRRDTRKLIRDSKLPTLVVTGSEDETTPGLEQAYQPLAAQANVELLSIDGADHFFRDLYADELVEAAMEFLEDR